MRHPKRSSAALALLAACAVTAGAHAEDKRPYSLFNPTPDRLLRDMTTDRPDYTETPFTVDAGRVQIESTVFGYGRSRPDSEGAVTESYELATTNVRIGLTPDLEAGFVWQPYGVVRTHRTGALDLLKESGIGGLELRAKFNLWGNDAFKDLGSTALGILPFITLPTDRHNGISPEVVEGGIIVPFAIKLSDKFGLGINAGATFTRDDVEYVGTASLSYEWSDKFGTYYEVATAFGGGDGDKVVLATGLTYKITENLQLDAGVNLGVSSAADRINPFVGLSTRF